MSLPVDGVNSDTRCLELHLLFDKATVAPNSDSKALNVNIRTIPHRPLLSYTMLCYVVHSNSYVVLSNSHVVPSC